MSGERRNDERDEGVLLSVSPRAPQGALTAAQRQEVGPLVRDYLLAHPAVLLEMSEQLDAQQQHTVTQQVQTALQAALLHDAASPVVHPDGAVTVVQFSDYQCIWCARMAPVVARFVEENPDVCVVFKEFPIFGRRWLMSVQAAWTGLTLWHLKGADAYLAYHNAIFASGELSQPAVDAALHAAGAAPLTLLPETGKTLQATEALALALQISGTPAFIVMPTRNALPAQVTPLYGAAERAALQAAVANARQGCQ